MKFRKNPVVIDAVQWFENGDHPDDNSACLDANGDPDWREGKIVRYYRHPQVPGASSCQRDNCGRVMHDHGWIDTLEGGHVVCPGDWVITGVAGERYPCKPDIFEQTYEPVTDTSAPRNPFV